MPKRARLKRGSSKVRQSRMKKLTMADVIRMNQEKGMYWFSDDAMRFFKSQVESPLFANKYFVTSEKREGQPRLYSIREFDPKSGSVSTYGEFQGYGTRAQALKKVKELVGDV